MKGKSVFALTMLSIFAVLFTIVAIALLLGLNNADTATAGFINLTSFKIPIYTIAVLALLTDIGIVISIIHFVGARKEKRVASEKPNKDSKSA